MGHSEPLMQAQRAKTSGSAMGHGEASKSSPKSKTDFGLVLVDTPIGHAHTPKHMLMCVHSRTCKGVAARTRTHAHTDTQIVAVKELGCARGV